MTTKFQILAGMAIAFVVLGGAVQAQSADDFLMNVEGICLRNMHDVSVVGDVVKAAGARDLPTELRRGIAPPEGELLGAWYLEIDGFRLMIGTSEGGLRGETISTCAVVTQTPATEAIVTRMNEILDIQLLSDDTEGYQRYRHYETNFAGADIMITILTGTHPSTSDILNLSVQSGFARSATQITHESSCRIDEDIRRIISSTLCGQAAPEREYRFFGDNCARKSIEARLRDTAAQIVLFEKCGDREFANRLASASIMAMDFMQELLPCTGENFDIQRILDEAVSDVNDELMNERCTASTRMRLNDRRPAFEQMIDMANGSEMKERIYRKLGVEISPEGSVIKR